MIDREKVIKALERCKICEMTPTGTKEGIQAYIECEYTTGLYCRKDKLIDDVLAMLKDQTEGETEHEG